MVRQILSIRLSRSFSTRSRQGICLDYEAYTQDAVILFARDSRTCSRADLVFLPRTPVTSSTRVKRPLPRNINLCGLFRCSRLLISVLRDTYMEMLGVSDSECRHPLLIALLAISLYLRGFASSLMIFSAASQYDMLLPAAWAYRYPAKVSRQIQQRQQNLPKHIQDIAAWKARLRLCKRFRRLTARGKNPNVAVTAIARELACFMWAIAQEVKPAA